MSEKLTPQPPLFAEATSAAHLPFYVQNLNKRKWQSQKDTSSHFRGLNSTMLLPTFVQLFGAAQIPILVYTIHGAMVAPLS